MEYRPTPAIRAMTIAPPSLYYWAPAPNRHLDPLLGALRAAGALRHEYYGSARLHFSQLGTPSVGDPAARTFLGEASPATVSRLLPRLASDAVHIVHGLRDLSATVMVVMPRQRRAVFVISESPLPRPLLSPRRVLRDARYRRELRQVTAVFALSRYAAAAMDRFGVPPARILPMVYAAPAVASNRRIAAAPHLLFCGRAIRRKGLDLLLAALCLLRTTGLELTLDVVGEGPEAERFVAGLARHRIASVVHGAVDSARALELMASADTLVVPSLLWEGWGYVVSEALAIGTPVVVSDVVGAAELVVPGINGFSFRSNDVEALASAIRGALHLARQATPEVQRCHGELAEAASAGPVADYVLHSIAALLGGEPAPEAPWHRAIRRLGGNGSLDWWSFWARGEAMPKAPAPPKRLLRHL